MSQQDIGRFIAEKRRAKNLTQEQLAELLNVSNKTVSKWETGKSMPDYSIVESLCRELAITVSELLAGKENSSEGTSGYTDEQVALLLYKAEQTESKNHIFGNGQLSKHIHTGVNTGITMGSALAMIISYTTWKSIGWAIIHGFLSWGYVIYYLIKH